MIPQKAIYNELFRGRQILVILLLVGVDLISLGLAFMVAVGIRWFSIRWFGGTIPADVFLPILRQGLVIFIVVYALTGLYPGFGRTAVEETQQIFYSLTLGYGVLGLIIYFQQAGLELSRSIFIMGWILGCLFNMVFRFAARNRFSLLPWWGTPVLVVGSVVETNDVVQKLLKTRRLGLRPVLVLDETCNQEECNVSGVPVIGSRSVIQSILDSTRIGYAVYVGGELEEQILRWLGERFSNVLVVLEYSPLGSLWVRTMDLDGRLTLKTQYHLLDRKATITKRAFDLLISLMFGIITLPFMALIALLIRLDSTGPVVFAQERMGRGGKVFRCFKFRTMHVGAEAVLGELIQRDPAARQEYQMFHKLADDPRITRVGKILRKYSLDELPQIWNILTGELSLVGPRAYLPSEREEMGAYASLILRVQPGLTGWWQVMGRHNTTFKERLQLDEYYLSNWSLWVDEFIIIKTIWILVSGKGA
jgi:Undecaprenyl-phosphate galactose phosphotransferase WbaP